MRRTTRLMLTTLVFALLLVAAVGTASARRFSMSNQQIRFTWTAIEFTGARTVRCPMTLTGNTHSRTIEKIVNSLIGAITGGNTEQPRCAGGRIAVINGDEEFNGRRPATSLPWHLTYEGFTGTLPNIVTMRLLVARFRFGLTTAECTDGEYGEARDNLVFAAVREMRGAITSLLPVERRNIMTRVAGNILFCPGTLTVTGTGAVADDTTARITLTLI